MKFTPGHNIVKAATAWKPEHFSLQSQLETLWCSEGQSTAPDAHGRTIKLNIIKSGFYYIYYY